LKFQVSYNYANSQFYMRLGQIS